jgi:hypothetical protein
VYCVRDRAPHKLARKTARCTCFTTGTYPALYIDPRAASLLLAMRKVCRIADAFHSLVPHGGVVRWIGVPS